MLVSKYQHYPFSPTIPILLRVCGHILEQG